MKRELLQRLTEAFGPSSVEDEVRHLLEEELHAAGVSTETSRAGDLFVHLAAGEGAPHVLLLAHMDEAGLMLTEIEEEGFLRFDTLGRISPRALCGRFVMLGNETARVRGLTAAKGIHLQDREERKRVPRVEDLYIDVGADDRAAAEALLSPGDVGTFDTSFAVFGEEEQLLRGKALDDRIGCAVLLSLLLRWHKAPPPVDLTVGFLCRCEAVPSTVGAVLAARAPEVAILVDAISANDIGDKPRDICLGGGAVLPFSVGRELFDRELHALARAVATRKGIPFSVPAQVEERIDALGLHAAGAGARCLCVGYPVRYAKTPTGVAACADVTALEDLLLALVPQLAKEN